MHESRSKSCWHGFCKVFVMESAGLPAFPSKYTEYGGIDMNTLAKLVLVLSAAAFTAACEEKGPMEEFGEDIDEMVEEVEQAADDACENIKEQASAQDTDC